VSVAVLFLILALLLIVLLALSLIQAGTAANSISEQTLDYENLLSARAGGDGELAERLFGPDDWEFVNEFGSSKLREKFVRQRKALALTWVSTIRADVTRLMRLHRIAARTSSELKPASELRVTFNYLCFEATCQFVVCVIWLHGPVGINGMVRRVGKLYARVGEAVNEFLPRAESGTDGPVI
jgi:hypothetical protein